MTILIIALVVIGTFTLGCLVDLLPGIIPAGFSVLYQAFSISLLINASCQSTHYQVVTFLTAVLLLVLWKHKRLQTC